MKFGKDKIKIDKGFVRYNPVFIDENSRKEMTPEGSNLFTREYGLMPKTGDYMEMGRGCFGGSGTYFVPVRRFDKNLTNSDPVDFVLDMADSWNIALRGCTNPDTSFFMSNAREYDAFREYGVSDPEAAVLKRENTPDVCKIVLVGNDLSVLYEEKRGFKPGDGKMGLTNFYPGMKPFFGCFDSKDYFPPVDNVSADDLVVRAVLHPLYGLPKVLLQEGRGSDWTD